MKARELGQIQELWRGSLLTISYYIPRETKTAARRLIKDMRLPRFFHERHQFRLALCGHKVVEAGAACLLLMVQGQLGEVTLAHLTIAGKTGLLAALPVLGITFTRHARHLVNKWTASLILGLCTFVADAAIHPSHYPGEYTEAMLTAMSAFAFSILISYTLIGKQIEKLAEALLSNENAPIS